MKRNLIVAALAGFGMLLGCGKNPTTAPGTKTPGGDLLLRSHFIGTTGLFTDTNAAKLKEIWALPSSSAFRDQTLTKLARAPFLTVSNQLPKAAADQAALFRPLLDDLLVAESFTEWRGPAGGPTEFALAIRLGDERAQGWQTNLWQVMQGWNPAPPVSAKIEKLDGWEAKIAAGPNLFSFVRAGQWVVVGLGQGPLTLRSNLLQKIQSGGRPVAVAQNYWLDAEGDLERWKPWLPALAAYQLPAAHLTLSNKADYVRTTLKLATKTPHGWKYEPWLMPTNLIRDPLVGFTAAQGIAPLLKPLSSFQKLEMNPVPNQFTVWSQSGLPFLQYASVPSQKVPEQLKRLVKPLSAELFATNGASTSRPLGSIDFEPSRSRVVWKGLPYIVPALQPLKIGSQEFIVGELFPATFRSNSAPPELFGQVVGRTNLAYYDWEITQEQITRWRALHQLGEIISGRHISSTNLASQKWVRAVAPFLGNAATEVTVTSPSEFTLVRKSHLGLTGFELIALSRWFESVEFPNYGYYPLQPRRTLLPRRVPPSGPAVVPPNK